MKREHIHNWIYNPVKGTLLRTGIKYFVLRFCDKCLKVEEIELGKE